MTSQAKYGEEEIKRIKDLFEEHFEPFRKNVSHVKLCQSFPEAKLDIELFIKEFGRSPSKDESFEIIYDFLFKQTSSEAFENLEQFLKEQKHWILKDIFPDADIGREQVKPEDKNKECSIHSAQIEKDIQMVETESLSKSGAAEVIGFMKTNELVNANIAYEVVEEKHANGEQASDCVKETKRSTKPKEPNLVGGLVLWTLQRWLSRSTTAVTGARVMIIVCLILLIPFAAMESSVLKIWPLSLVEPPENVSQLPFCQEMENNSLLVMHIGIDTISDISKGIGVNPMAYGLLSKMEYCEIVNPACQENQTKSISPYINVQSIKTYDGGTKIDLNQSMEVDNMETCNTTADGLGSNTFITNVKEGFEHSTMRECPINMKSSHDDISLWFDLNVTVHRAMSETDISYPYFEAVSNADYSTAEGKNGVLGSVSERMVRNRNPEMPELNIDIKTSYFQNMKSSSIQDVSTMNGSNWSEQNQLLVILLPTLLFRLCKARVLKWKKEKRQKGHQNIKKICSLTVYYKYIGKQIKGIGGYFTRFCFGILFVSCFSSTIAGSTPSTSKPKIHRISATVGEYLSISCGEVVRSDFKWYGYLTSANRPETLCKSGNIANKANTRITCCANGTIIFQSVQTSDMGEYHCIVLTDSDDDLAYTVNVQNSTVNSSAVQDQVTPGSIPKSKRYGGIAAGVVCAVLAAVLVAVLIYSCVKKCRKRQSVTEQRPRTLTNGRRTSTNGFVNGDGHGVPGATRTEGDTTIALICNSRNCA